MHIWIEELAKIHARYAKRIKRLKEEEYEAVYRFSQNYRQPTPGKNNEEEKRTQ